MERLNILWTTDNKDTILHMLVMYATNSKLNGWWQQVNLIIWGASAKLVGTDNQIQEAIVEMFNHGISIEACKACCDNLGVTDKLNERKHTASHGLAAICFEANLPCLIFSTTLLEFFEIL